VGAGAGGAGAFVAKIAKRILAVMVILQSILIPLDFEMAMCSGSAFTIDSLDIADAGNAPDGGNHSFQLLLISNF